MGQPFWYKPYNEKMYHTGILLGLSVLACILLIVSVGMFDDKNVS